MMCSFNTPQKQEGDETMELEIKLSMPFDVSPRVVENERAKLGNAIFRGRKRGVELTHRATEIIGQPIPLANGRFLLAEKFGRHRYHEDAEPLYYALGKQVSRRAALDAARKNKHVVRYALDGLMHNYDPDQDWAAPPASDIGRRIGRLGNVTYHAAANDTLAVRNEYDFPPAWYRIDLPADVVATALASCGAT